MNGVRWESEEKIHITLKFIGDMKSVKVHELKEVLKNSCREIKSIPLNVKELSAFPSFSKPRVIVLNLDKSKELSYLYDLIQENIERLGIAMDTRKFLPHITIGRVKSGFKISGEPKSIENIEFVINEIALINSELSHRGSIYSNLGVYKLT